jgi:hypothetical protein
MRQLWVISLLMVAGCGTVDSMEVPPPDLPEVVFVQPGSLTDEKIGTQDVFLKLSRTSAEPVSVEVLVSSESAVPGQDYNVPPPTSPPR